MRPVAGLEEGAKANAAGAATASEVTSAASFIFLDIVVRSGFEILQEFLLKL